MFKKNIIIAIGIFVLLGLPILFNTDSGEENTKIKIKFDKEVKHFTAQSLGIELQKKSAAQGTFSSILSAFPQKNGFILTYDQSESEKIIREQFNLEFPRSASFHLENGELVIVPEQDAPFFDVETLMKEIADSYPEKTNFKIKEIDFTPATEEEVEPFSDLAKLLLTEGLKANFEGRDFTFPMQEKDLVFTKTGPSLSAPFATYVLKTLQDQVSHQEENLIILEADLSTLSLAKTEGHVRDGFLVDPPQTLQSIQTALTSHQNTFTIEGTILKGRVINETQLDLGEMTLIGAGRSNFARSPGGRDYNIRRALNEYYNGALIPTDGEFSYNALLGPITYSAGWKGSLAIFLGTDLEEVPGGGLCQVSTTIYRAALAAGLDILDQINHSLYVFYYADYGDGLDATIYPPSQDFIFKNNTGHPILIEAYDNGTDAIVNFYGTPDGRSVTLDGPFTQSNQPKEVVDAIGYLRYYQLAWRQTITNADQTKIENWLISTYHSPVPQYKDLFTSNPKK